MTTEDEFGNKEVKELGIDVPEWIEQDITVYDVQAIVQGGCASGAYMPAVTYWWALKTMSEHGDDILDELEGVYVELIPPPTGTSWAGMAVYYVSMGVELWASGLESELDDKEAEWNEEEKERLEDEQIELAEAKAANGGSLR